MTFYDYIVTDIDGNEKNLADFKGKPSLIVNVASACGFTPQYKDLQKMYEKYEGNLLVLGFPCNQFGKQEPGTNEEIKEFCSTKFKVNFPMFDKIEVKGGNIAPIYQYLNSESQDEPKWNFHKYIVDKEGNVVSSFSTKTKPSDDKIVTEIEKLL